MAPLGAGSSKEGQAVIDRNGIPFVSTMLLIAASLAFAAADAEKSFDGALYPPVTVECEALDLPMIGAVLGGTPGEHLAKYRVLHTDHSADRIEADKATSFL